MKIFSYQNKNKKSPKRKKSKSVSSEVQSSSNEQIWEEQSFIDDNVLNSYIEIGL